MRRSVESKRRYHLLEEYLLAQSAAGTVLEEGLDRPVYLVDIYCGIAREQHRGSAGSVWPPSAETLIESLRANDRLRAVLDLDADTLRELAAKAPAGIESVRAALATGRLELVSGLSRPIVAAVSGESILRQLPLGVMALSDKLGVRAESYLLGEDQFFPQLPQILLAFGFRQVILAGKGELVGPANEERRGTQRRAAVRLQGPDGSEIAAAFAIYGETAGVSNHVDPVDWSNERLESFRGGSHEQRILCRVHTFDSPDGPAVARAAVAARDDVRFVTPREYFEGAAPAVTTRETATTYTAGNRRFDGMSSTLGTVEAEQTLLLAERLDALAYAMGRESDERELGRAWRNLLDAQEAAFSDQPSKENANAAHRAGREIAETAAKFLASHVDSSDVEGRGLVVFNPSSWPRDEYIEVTLGGEAFRISHAGREVPSQIVDRRDGYVTLGFVAQVPALGYRLLEVRHLPPHEVGAAPVAMPGSRSFANSFYAAQLGEDGSLSVEVAGSGIVESAGYLTVWKDGRAHDSRETVSAIEAHRQGPVFHRYLIEGRLAGMPFRQRMTFYRALPRIDLRTEIDFGSDATLVSPQSDGGPPADEGALAVNLRSPLRRLFVDSPFFVGDAVEGRAAALSLAGLDDEWQRGIGFLNRGAAGYHFDASGGVLKSVLASREAYVSGSHSWECAFIPTASRLHAVRAAADYRLPCLGVFLLPHAGSLPSEGSFLMIGPDEALLSAMFVRQGKVFVRVWDSSSSAVQASVGSGGPLSLRRCSLDLVDQGPADDAVPLRPWGVQTLRLAGAGETS